VLDLETVPRREGHDPYEVMLSESQERMLVIAKREHAADVKALFEHWELHCEEIGQVTDSREVVIRENGVEHGRVPAELATDPPQYVREGVRPAELAELNAFDPGSLPDLAPEDAAAALLRLLARPNIASKRGVFRTYDQQVLNNTVVPPGGDAAVLRVWGTDRGIALKTDCNGRYCYLDPTLAPPSPWPSARATSSALAPRRGRDGLPELWQSERPDVYYQLSQAVHGIAEACSVFEGHPW
jgi:phosphoribosylformylglycinamidine synthase